MGRKVEIYCGGYYDAHQAAYGGASKIVLSHHQYSGGLTPTIGTLLKIKEDTHLEVVCILRNREGGVHYHEDDIECMFLDAEILLDNGADGLAFGFLDEEGDLDIPLIKKMVELTHSYHKKAYFYQTIDLVNDIDQAMNILITIGIDGIYTTGGQKDLLRGKVMITYLQVAYGEHIQIIASGSTEKIDVPLYMDDTGISHILCPCIEQQIDATDIYSSEYPVVDWELVEQLVEEVEEDIHEFEVM